jgi:hypothetical protein
MEANNTYGNCKELYTSLRRARVPYQAVFSVGFSAPARIDTVFSGAYHKGTGSSAAGRRRPGTDVKDVCGTTCFFPSTRFSRCC